MKGLIRIDLSKFNINKVVKHLVFSDLLLFAGWGLIGPIMAVFVLERVPEATLITVGITSSIYWVVKSIAQIPISLFLDRHKGERDELYTLIGSLILAGFVAMAFLLVDSKAGLYIVSFMHGIAFGMYIPSWYAIFSRHLDKDHYSFDWSLDSTSVGLASGVTALIGGTVANFFGFSSVFVGVSILSFLSALVIFALPNIILPKKTTTKPLIADHTPTNIMK